MFRFGNSKGVSPVITLIVGALFSAVLVMALSGLMTSRKGIRKIELENVAENLAAELLETFIALKDDQLSGLLSRSTPFPQPGGALVPAYPLCAHVNIIDRAATPVSGPPTILNPDPIARLPANLPFENTTSPKHAANRFYQVTVVQKSDLAVNPAACGYAVEAGGGCGVIGGKYALCGTERYMVTVGVSFVRPGHTEADPERVVLSALIDP